MDHLCTVVLHLLRDVRDIPTGAAVAGGKPDKFHVFSLVALKRTLAVFQCSQAFPPGAGAVPVADDDPESDWLSYG